MKRYIPILIVLIFIVQACGGGAETVAPEPAPEGTQAVATEVVESDSATESVASDVTTSIEHKVIPQGGTTDRAYAHDNENVTTFDNKNVLFGDEFSKNRFERPFTANDMEYLPDLDILDFGITSDEQFFYISIIFSGLDPATNSLTGIYGVEIDRDADGKAELMLATTPSYSTEFTADNVIVLADLDGDIGGPTINRPDLNFEGNGYDGIIFDLKQNIHPEDPDLAWVRFVEGGRPSIEIAYRKWIFRGGDEKFMWSVFSLGSAAGLNPAKFNIHDKISEIEAGSPTKENPNYPIKALSAMDNTCRVPLGFQASGFEPLGCYVNGPDIAVADEEAADEGSGGGGGGGGGNVGELPQFCQLLPEVCNRVIPPVIPPNFRIVVDG